MTEDQNFETKNIQIGLDENGNTLEKQPSYILAQNLSKIYQLDSIQIDQKLNVKIFNPSEKNQNIETQNQKEKKEEQNVWNKIKNTIKQYTKIDLKPKGAVGLLNLHNTCYLNSAIQCLSHSVQLKLIVTNSSIKAPQKVFNENQKELFCFYKFLMFQIWEEDNQYVDPTFFKEALEKYNQQFSGFKQKDALECVSTILDGLNQFLREKSKENVEITMEDQNLNDQQLSQLYKSKYLNNNCSIITQLFSGQLKTEIKCLECEMKNEKNTFYKCIQSNKQYLFSSGQNTLNPKSRFRIFDNFTILYLPIERNRQENNFINLEGCLKNFIQTDILSEGNQWFCSSCNKDQCSLKTTKIYYVSKFLILGFQRFEENKKNVDYVEFPLKLNLKDYLENKSQNSDYQLYGLINHFGGLKSGHYTAFCKNFDDKNWYEFNDKHVKLISEEEVVTKHAYGLFYRQKDI